MSDYSISTTLLSVGIISIIIFSVLIVWLIVWCEKRRRAKFRFRPKKPKIPKRSDFLTVKTSETVNSDDKPPNMEKWSLHENSPVCPGTLDDKEEEAVDIINIPIQKQIAAILGSFPDITDYLSLYDEDSERESEPDVIMKTDSSAPPLIYNGNKGDSDDCPSFHKQCYDHSADNVSTVIKNKDTTIPDLNDAMNVKNDFLVQGETDQSSKTTDADPATDLIHMEVNNRLIDSGRDDDIEMLLETTI